MKELIKKILHEVISTSEDNMDMSNYFKDIKSKIESEFPYIDLTYKLYNNNSKGKFFINIKNNNTNYKSIWNDITLRINELLKEHPNSSNPNFIFSFFNTEFKNDVINKFKNSNYIKEREDILKKIKLDVSSYIKTFDGDTSKEIENLIDEAIYINSESVHDDIKHFIQQKTDVPLNIKIESSDTYKTVFIRITPDFNLDDFINCRYTKWFFPDNIWHVYESIRNAFPDFAKPPMLLNVELKWPREIGNFLVKKNEELRSKLPKEFEDIYAIKVDYKLCSEKPQVHIGTQYNQPLPTNDRQKLKRIIKSVFPNATITSRVGDYWFAHNLYSPNDKSYWSKEQLYNFFVESSLKKHGKIYEYSFDNFKDLETKTSVYCKKHNTWFDVIPTKHINGKKCPFDNESKGEKLVRVFLENKGIKFLTYHRIKKCFSKINGKCYTLPFDFYLPDLNILIEYDGEQHYKPVNIWGGEEGFERQKKLDAIKTKFAKDNNLKLIRIPYTVKKPQQLDVYLNDDILKQ